VKFSHSIRIPSSILIIVEIRQLFSLFPPPSGLKFFLLPGLLLFSLARKTLFSRGEEVGSPPRALAFSFQTPLPPPESPVSECSAARGLVRDSRGALFRLKELSRPLAREILPFRKFPLIPSFFFFFKGAPPLPILDPAIGGGPPLEEVPMFESLSSLPTGTFLGLALPPPQMFRRPYSQPGRSFPPAPSQ